MANFFDEIVFFHISGVELCQLTSFFFLGKGIFSRTPNKWKSRRNILHHIESWLKLLNEMIKSYVEYFDFKILLWTVVVVSRIWRFVVKTLRLSLAFCNEFSFKTKRSGHHFCFFQNIFPWWAVRPRSFNSCWMRMTSSSMVMESDCNRRLTSSTACRLLYQNVRRTTVSND